METPKKSQLKFILLHNFSNKEISLILSKVKSLYPNPEHKKSLIFAKTTEKSLKMNVKELINDASEDHLFLLENPPPSRKKKS